MIETPLQLLRRVPDDIILALGCREFDMGDGDCCICGWAVREALARVRSVAAEQIMGDDGWDCRAYSTCAALFGGSEEDWRRLYYDVDNPWKLPDIEAAFAQRLNEVHA